MITELDDGKIYRKPLYLMVKPMVSCRFSLNQSTGDGPEGSECLVTAMPASSPVNLTAVSCLPSAVWGFSEKSRGFHRMFIGLSTYKKLWKITMF